MKYTTFYLISIDNHLYIEYRCEKSRNGANYFQSTLKEDWKNELKNGFIVSVSAGYNDTFLTHVVKYQSQ